MMDPFVRNVILITVGLLVILCLSVYIGSHSGAEFAGVDDVVETMAAVGHDKEPHPFLELPGDTEVGAFTIAALGMGMIIGYLWRKLISEQVRKPDSQ